MIILQICLIPLSVLLLLGAIFAIGSAGVTPPEKSTWIDEPLSAVTTGSVHLPRQSQSINISGKEAVDLLQAEIVLGNSILEAPSELPLYKL